MCNFFPQQKLKLFRFSLNKLCNFYFIFFIQNVIKQKNLSQLLPGLLTDLLFVNSILVIFFPLPTVLYYFKGIPLYS